MHLPGIEPGSGAWEAPMITTTPQMLSFFVVMNHYIERGLLLLIYAIEDGCGQG